MIRAGVLRQPTCGLTKFRADLAFGAYDAWNLGILMCAVYSAFLILYNRASSLEILCPLK